MMVTHQKLLLYFRLEIYFFCSDFLAPEGIVCVCSIISKLQSCREPKKNHTRRKSKPTTSSITESPYPLISHYPECRVYFIIIECSHSLAQTILKDQCPFLCTVCLNYSKHLCVLYDCRAACTILTLLLSGKHLEGPGKLTSLG